MDYNSQIINPEDKAQWITDPDCNPTGYGIYHFRKKFRLKNLPSSFNIDITADNRYRLFVNGKSVCSGSARGDLSHWYYETVDIKPFLKPGTNLIAVIVWNMGEFKPVAQISLMTGLFVRGYTNIEKVVNTNDSWKVIQSDAYTPCSIQNTKRLLAYMVVGPGDRVLGSKYLWDWDQLKYHDKKWSYAKKLIKPKQGKVYNIQQWWKLTPRNIPMMFETKLRLPLIRRTKGIMLSEVFFKNKRDLVIAPYKQVSLLVDQTYLTVGYPELILSYGKSACVRLTYAEALFDIEGNKGNRNDIANKEIAGNYDVFYQDGGIKRTFRPLWLRTFRYVQLDITTHDQHLVIEDFYSIKTGYPFQLKASFKSDDGSLEEIWKVGWRTAQLCAGEIYYDSPYYEQLQYAADSRIQALVSLYITGDDRLMKKAILDIFHSKIPNSLTQSRYPSHKIQIIPPFSLYWISMIYDFWMHRVDDNFIKQFFPAIIEILGWFLKKINKNTGMLGPLPYWNFVDWDNFDLRGSAPGARVGGSSILTLQLAVTLKQTAELMEYFHLKVEASEYRNIADILVKNTWNLCYSKQIGLIADTPDLSTFSKHAAIWAILSNAVNDINIESFLKNSLSYEPSSQLGHFYQFYLSLALNKANLSDIYYYEQLKPWKNMISLGLTTFAETKDETRSDCHGWSASPIYNFMSNICGLLPLESGFKKILIKPAMGKLNEIKIALPHPAGIIIVEITSKKKIGFKAMVSLPKSLSGEFHWGKFIYQLTGGLQFLEM